MWGLSVWEYYYRVGDRDWLEGIWSAVEKNIDGAMGFVHESGLFSIDAWNFFDWAKIDSIQKTVMHNSMLLVGSIDAAVKCAKVLNQTRAITKFNGYRKALVKAINRHWDEEKGAYPDSFLADGKPSESICQHTSFLAVLYDIIEKKNLGAAIKNILEPPQEMVEVGSPFAIMYLYETLEKIGRADLIIKSITDNYTPMLQADATTVWESFPGGTLVRGEFPTRSHAHAWSSSPIYFFNRIILGVRQTSAGCRSFDISPDVSSLQYAKGEVATPLGQVSVSWRKEGKDLNISFDAPKAVKLRFVKNSSMSGFKVNIENKQK